MELRQVGYFVAVAGTGSMSRAAVSLAMTQSGLSRQISALESELSVRLFERTGHGVVLTDAGRALLPDARAMLGHADALRSAAERHQGQPKGRVVLAVTPMVAQAITTPVLAAARAVHAGIQVEIMESSGSMVGEWLANGRADIAVSFAPPEQFSGALDGERLFEDGLCLVSPPGTPACAALPFDDLGEVELILPSDRSGMRRRLDEIARGRGVTFRVALQADSLATTIEATAAGLGHTVLPGRALAAEIAARGLAVSRIVEPAVPCWLSLYLARARASSPSIGAIAALIRSQARDIGRPGGMARGGRLA
jgi:LysR family nitrogen assimilation transcriptional regulator